MSRVSDVLIEINEYFDTDLSDDQIAEQIGCPVSWVKDARAQAFLDEHVVPFECENW